MSGKWFYRMFGQDFGPVTMDELKVLAETGMISNDDEVRHEDASLWSLVGSLKELNPEAASSPAVATVTAKSESPATGPKPVEQGWYCMFHGQEMGPLTFEDLLDFASQGQLVADDEVKLGATGKWRRVGSIGRLVSVLPYHEPQTETTPAPPAPKSAAVIEAPLAPQAVPAPSPRVAPAPAAVTAPPPVAAAPQIVNVGIQAAELELIKAQISFEATSQAAKQLVAWATSPTCNPQWWAVLNGIENGPVDFGTIFDWTVSGKIQQTDYVRNGVFGQYGPVTNLPGLFSAAGIMKQAQDAYELAKSRAPKELTTVAPVPAATPSAMPAVVLPPPPVSPPPSQPAPIQSLPEVTPSAPAPRSSLSNPDAPVRSSSHSMSTMSEPEPRPSSNPYAGGGYSGGMSNNSTVSRPMAIPPKPSKAARRPSSGSSGPSLFASLQEKLKEPAAMGGVAVIAVVLLVVGWMYMPAGRGADIAKYRELKKLLTDVRAKRDSKATDFSEIQKRAEKLTKEFTPILKTQASSEYPYKQHLLWAVRDELPRMMKVNLAEESQEEKDFSDRLNNVARLLNIKD